MLEGVHCASLSKSERADRQRYLEPVKEDMEDAETSRQRGEKMANGERAPSANNRPAMKSSMVN